MSEAELPSSGDSGEANEGPGHSGRQATVIRALAEIDNGLSAMYTGAINRMNRGGNPDRHAQAAHSLRELMEKLPEHLNVPTNARKETLKAKARECEDAFNNAQRRSGCYGVSGGWTGEIDQHLRKMLQRMEKCFQWFGEHAPRRREEARGALRQLDGTGRPPPEPLEDLNIAYWERIRDYFQRVAHHRVTTTDDEMWKWIVQLEDFLLDRLVPRTFEDFDEIDSLIGDEEGNDEA